MRRTQILSLLFLACSALSCLGQSPALTTHDVCMIKSVGTAVVDPTGEFVAYTRSIPLNALVEDGSARTELWLTKRGPRSCGAHAKDDACQT